jgi:O-antigen biosynthesis protein
VAVLQSRLSSLGASVFPGGAWDDWDLEVRGGLFGGVRLRIAVEEHGEGRQLVRWRYGARPLRAAVALAGTLAGLAVVAALDGEAVAAVFLAVAGVTLTWAVLLHWATAAGAAHVAVNSLGEAPELPAAGPRHQAATNGALPPSFPVELEDSAIEDARVVRQ